MSKIIKQSDIKQYLNEIINPIETIFICSDNNPSKYLTVILPVDSFLQMTMSDEEYTDLTE